MCTITLLDLIALLHYPIRGFPYLLSRHADTVFLCLSICVDGRVLPDPHVCGVVLWLCCTIQISCYHSVETFEQRIVGIEGCVFQMVSVVPRSQIYASFAFLLHSREGLIQSLFYLHCSLQIVRVVWNCLISSTYSDLRSSEMSEREIEKEGVKSCIILQERKSKKRAGRDR